MEQKVTRGERLLANYAKRSGMSEEGKQWLIGAIDPFHDKPLQLSGYPDGTAGRSVVQCIKLAMDIAKPTGLTAGAKWDVLISTDNFLDSEVLNQMDMGIGVSSIAARGTATSTVRIGGLVARNGPTGSDLSISTTAIPTIQTQFLQVPDSTFQGKMRVLAQGFEVCNTSNELVKNGTVTCFEQNQMTPEDSFALAISTASGAACVGAGEFLPVARLPSSLAQATTISGAKSWEAKDGCLLTCRQNSLSNPAKKAMNLSALYMADTPDYPSNPAPGTTWAKIGTPFGVMLGPEPAYSQPFHGKSAYFTALSDETTLHVNYNVWVERFPTQQQYDLMTLATESCDYDPIALEAWSTISAQMPVAAKFNENGLGDWFTGEVASLIDGWTGTSFASSIDKWQKDKFSPAHPAQVQNVNTPDKREKMNEKAARKQKDPKQGPMKPDGRFKQNAAKPKQPAAKK